MYCRRTVTMDGDFLDQLTRLGLCTGEEESTSVPGRITCDEDLPPIHHLPVEILSTIFEWVVVIYYRTLHPKLRSDWWSAFPARDTSQLSQKLLKLRSPVEYWFDLNLVCRRWRRVALSTPTLWTYINMSELKTTKQSTLLRNRSAALSFDRSGTLPLMIYCTSAASPFPLPDIHRHRVRQLLLHNLDSDYMGRLVSSTPSLDTLVICKHLFIARTFIRFKERWTVPSLKTLLSFRCSFWRFGSFGNLRHLVVEAEILPDNSISSIFNVLTENPHLENLVFVDVTAIVLPSQRLTEYATILPIVHMRSLERIKVIEAQGPTLAWLFDQKLTFLASVARDYTFTNPFYHLLDSESPLVNAWIPFDPHPVKRLYISEDDIYATDGTSATHLSIAGDSQRGFFFTVFLPFFESETSELWLSLPDDPSFKDTSDWETILERLRGVTTLSLLLHGVTVEIWLGLLSSADRFFPLLTSLQIHHPKPEYHLRYIVFLMARRQSGHPVETLRFVGAPEAWKEGELRVSFEDLVGSVVFVDEGSLPQFELPAVCTTDSDVHAYWNKWEL